MRNRASRVLSLLSFFLSFSKWSTPRLSPHLGRHRDTLSGSREAAGMRCVQSENPPGISPALLEFSPSYLQFRPQVYRFTPWIFLPPPVRTESSSFFTRKATYITSDKEGGEEEGDLWCRAAALVVRRHAALLRYLLLGGGKAPSTSRIS